MVVPSEITLSLRKKLTGISMKRVLKSADIVLARRNECLPCLAMLAVATQHGRREAARGAVADDNQRNDVAPIEKYEYVNEKHAF